MIYITHKIIILLKITWITLKIIFSNGFLRTVIDFYFFKKKKIFSQHIMMESLSLEEEKMIKNLITLFRLENETKAIKYWVLRDIKNLF